MVDPGIGRGSVTADIDAGVFIPLTTRSMTGGQCSSDENKADLFTFLQGSLFHGDEYLIVFFYVHQSGVAVVISCLFQRGIQGGNGVRMDDGAVFVSFHPYLMRSQDDVVRAVGMLYGNGTFYRTVGIDGLCQVFLWGGMSQSQYDQNDNAQYEQDQGDTSAAELLGMLVCLHGIKIVSSRRYQKEIREYRLSIRGNGKVCVISGSTTVFG